MIKKYVKGEMKIAIMFVIIALLVIISGISGCVEEQKEETASQQVFDDQSSNESSVESADAKDIENENEELSFEEKVWKKRIDAAMAPSYCPNVTISRPNISYYTGPLIDTHFHIAALPDSPPGEEEDEEGENEDEEENKENNDEDGDDESDEDEEEMETVRKWGEGARQPLLGENIRISEIVCTLEQESTDKAFAFFPVYPEISMQLSEVVNRTMQKYPERFVPFVMPPDNDNDPDGSPTVNARVLQDMLEAYPELFGGYGEIGLYNRQGGAKELLPDDQRLKEIYPIIKEKKLLVYFHPGNGHADNLAKVLKEYPDINFIVHGDQIQQNIISLMDDHPNIYFTMNDLYGDEWLLRESITKQEFLEYFNDYEPLIKKDLAMYEHMINEHPDRFMWGTDRGGAAVWTYDPEVGQTLANYGRAFIARLNPSVQEKFAYKNAESLLLNKF